VTGAERLEKLDWLKVSQIVLVQGEVTDKGSVYAYQTQPLLTPERNLGENIYLRGMSECASIGKDRYNRTYATLSRSLTRLAARGLIQREGYRLRLTAAGHAWYTAAIGDAEHD
jgi:hypothetical protein